MHYKIGTRGSKLALIQTNLVKQKLEEVYPEDSFEIVIIKTKGDKQQNTSLRLMGGQGFFIKEIENQLLNNTIQIAVHSMKDLPSTLPEGLTLCKTTLCEDNRDVLVLREAKSLNDLKQGAIIATGSIRRERQLLKIRPDLQIVDIRGNVDTRIQKMQDNNYDGIVVAAAGLKRLHKEDLISEYLDTDIVIPSPTQGLIGIEINESDTELLNKINALYDEDLYKRMLCERTFLKEMNVTCKDVIGANTTIENNNIILNCVYGLESNHSLYYANTTGLNPIDVAKDAAVCIRKQCAGIVYLVGAGCGDPKLLTLGALEAIQDADCIIYDRLISQEILDYANKECEMIYAGKANHVHTLKQEEINALMVNKAMQYKKVVRLKGGDVFVFGRGGEEALYLKEHGVTFKIINGISSCIAGPAAAGIPITTRNVASGFRVISAHNHKDEFAQIDFDSIAKSKDTTIFLMGLSKLNEICTSLLNAHMDKDTKVAVISNATTNKQKTCIGTLETIVEEVNKKQLVSPAIIVVGEVVSLHDQLHTYNENNNDTREFYIPKINKEISNLTTLLRKDKKTVYEIQVGEIVYKNININKDDLNTDWILFTSKHGIKGFFHLLKLNKIDIRLLNTIKFGVIGLKTEKVLNEYGIYADFIPKEFNSEAFYNAFKEFINNNTNVIYFGDSKEHDLEAKLNTICNFKKYSVYENIEIKNSNISIIKDANVIFTAASNVDRFINILDEQSKEYLINTCTCYSIGKMTSAALRKYHIKNMIEAKESSYEGLFNIIRENRNEK